MKKTLIWLLVALLLLSAIACGGSTGSSETEAADKPAYEESEGTATEPEPQITEEPEPEPTEEPEPEPTEEPEEQWEPLGKVEAQPISLPKGYTLTEIGTMSDPDNRVSFRSDEVLITRTKDENDNTLDSMLTYLGEEIPGGPYAGCRSIGGGLYAIAKDLYDINSTGLVDENGEFLIPNEAAIIKRLTSDNVTGDSERFLYVIYSTGEVQSEDDAFFYVTDAIIAIGGPKEGDKLYSGYGKIYDLETKRFVDGITVTNPRRGAMEYLGDYFVLRDVDGSTAIYDCNGKQTIRFADTAQIECGLNYVVANNNYDTFEIYSGNGDLLYHTEDILRPISGSGMYVEKSHYDYEKQTTTYTVMDYYGNPCFSFEGSYISFSQEHGGVFLIYDNGTYRLVDINNNEIFTSDSNISYAGYGCWSFSYKSGDDYLYGLVFPDGNVIRDQGYNYKFVYKEKTGDGITEDYKYEMLVLNDPEHPLVAETDYVNELADGLVSFRTGRLKGVYDLFSGSELLAPEYSDIFMAYGNLYAYKDKVWTVYKLELN